MVNMCVHDKKEMSFITQSLVNPSVAFLSLEKSFVFIVAHKVDK